MTGMTDPTEINSVYWNEEKKIMGTQDDSS